MTPPAEDPHTASFTTAFLSYPHASSYNSHIDKLRSHEYPHLANQTYLDHAGATPYPRTILSAHGTDLLSTLYSNPHSAGSPGGDATRERVRAVRERVLRYLGASLEDYVVVFTSGATAGLRIVGEGLQWSKTGAEYWHLREVHTSVLGIRRFVDNDDDDNDDAYREGWVKDSAHAKGHKLKRTKCVTTEDVEAFLKPEIEAIYRDVLGANLMNDVGDAYNLFAFPAQCNHSGRRYPLSYINLFRLKNKSLHSSSSTSVSNPNNLPWRTLLDAASHLTTTPINLSSHPADFVVLSFYKLFGFPTGLGALVMRRDAALSLRKRYFGGGTVSSIVSDIPWQAFRGNDHLAARFEDGTIPFLQVLAVEKGFEFVEGVLGGWSSVSLHAECIAGFVYEQMSAMRHHNDQQPLCRMYSRHPAPSARHEDVSHPLLVYSQGPIINFSLLRPDGSYIGHTFVMQLAAMFNIHMRGGCFCNPGACHTALELSSEQVRENAEVHGHVCWDTKDIINDRPTGSLRVSFGACSTLDEAIAWLNFLKSTFLVGPLNPAAGPTLASSPPSTASSSVAQPHVQIITIYPIKSCGGYTPSTPWPIGETGFEMDRMWVVVDGEGRAITQKRVSRMALVKIVAVDLEQREVTVDAPGMPRCTVKWSIQDPGQAEEKAVRACSLGGEGRAVRVCGDR
ncbi:hypothetical protein HK104_005850 [Borealophlyctis nickersoniae]|nr:hypothetical protein HK104_005850 [Borealophlyctis nickersoniae]